MSNALKKFFGFEDGGIVPTDSSKSGQIPPVSDWRVCPYCQRIVDNTHVCEFVTAKHIGRTNELLEEVKQLLIEIKAKL